jgi:hypothetical protein
MNLLSHRCRVPFRARSAKPLESFEIDAHPDGDRIWATILQLRNGISQKRDADYPGAREAGDD